MKNKQFSLVLGILLILTIAVLAFILFINSGISFLGWLIMILLLLISGFIIFKFHAKGIKTIGLIGLFSAGAIMVTFLFTGGVGGVKSSVVSGGVDKSDLGNIMSGQYYFDDGDVVYYSNYDDQFKAHIYKLNKKTGATVPIFDGFGWSLVPDGDYLYFSGNTGTTIDGTYNLFRMNLNDYSYEIINSEYCFNMSLYKGWLYFINRDNSGKYTYKRLNLKDLSIKTLVEDGSGLAVVVYKKNLYYLDSLGYIIVSNTDGSKPTRVMDQTCSGFIIGNGKIIFNDGNTLKTVDTDGKNINTLREADNLVISTLNSKGNTVYYSAYSSNEINYKLYGYPYTLYSISFNGKDKREICTGTSYGLYINIIDNNVYTLDYIMDTEAGHPTQITIIRVMDNKGNNIKLLPN